MRTSKLSLLALILFTSCTSDLEKYEKEVASCMKDAKKELKVDYGNMGEAIAALDFEVAHKFYSCYSPAAFGDRGDRRSNGRINPRYDAALQLADAEVAHLVGLNEFDRALAVHEELVGNRKGEIKVGYSYEDGIIGADERFNIYKKTVLHFLEKEDAQSATKWAKRAPTDLTSKGIFTKDPKESQQADLLTLIAGY